MISEIPAELVTAAMAGATRRKCAVSIFAPFDAFRWAESEVAKQPVGATKREAKDVAWLLTCAARMREQDEFDKAAEALTYATRLRRDVVQAEALYHRLSGRWDELVHISEIERALGCAWGEKDIQVHGHTQRVDPYFWRLMEGMVRDSILDYVTHIDSAMTMFRGGEMGQNTEAMQLAMDGVRRATAHRLSNALLDRSTTAAGLVQLLTDMRDGWLSQHVSEAKARMARVLQGVRSLLRVVAAPDTDLEQVLQEEEATLTELFSAIPIELQEQLTQRRISIVELAPVFSAQHNGLVHQCVNVPPASFAVRASVLSRWIKRCGSVVSEVCTSVIATLRRIVNLSPLAQEWSGVRLTLATPYLAALRDHAGADRMVRWVPPSHLGNRGEPRVIVGDPNQHHTGLRVARLFSVLLDQARLGLLPAVTARASLLVPIVARFTSETEVSYERCVATKLRPVGAQCEHEWPDATHTPTGKRRQHPCPEPSDEMVALVQPAKVPARTALVVATPVATGAKYNVGAVPSKLLRDHAILHALALCLKTRKGYHTLCIGLDEVIAQVRGICPMLQDQSDASLRQSVRWVANEVIRRAHSQAIKDGRIGLVMEFNSNRDRTNKGHVGGVVCQGDGISFLFEYVSWCVNQMRFNGDAFCGVWNASRSAQSKAAAMAHKMAGHKP